jgi:hypothetical protein
MGKLPAELGRTANVRTGLDEQTWNNLAQELNLLPLISRLNVTITPSALNECLTIGDVAHLIASLAAEGAVRRDKGKNTGNTEEPDITILGGDITEDEDWNPRVNSEIAVWYATNRRPIGGPAHYSAARDDVVHYGRCRVFIPKSHKIGSIGSPVWKRILTLTDDRLRLIETKQYEVSEFWRGVIAQISDSELGQKK